MALSTLTSEGSFLPVHLADGEGPTLSPFPSSILPYAKSTGQSDSEISSATLPGHGSPGEDCGQPIAMHCNKCGASFWVHRSCLLRECPACYEKWASREARRAAWRVWCGASDAYWKAGIRARLLHVVVSLRFTGQSLSELRDDLRRILKKHGIAGGWTILHPFRQDGDGYYANDDTVHFHVVGVAPAGVKPGGESESVVFKVVEDKEYHDYRGFRSMRAVKRAMVYLLSHCGIIEGRHSATWFGSFSYNSLSQKKLEKEHPAAVEAMNRPRPTACPKCGSWDTEPDWLWDNTRWHCEWVDTRPPPRVPPPTLTC